MGSSIKNRIAIICITIIILILLVIGTHKYANPKLLGYDFAYYWNSARLFVQEGLYPYSDEVATQNQYLLFGHEAQNNQDPSYFKNPIYGIFLLIPFSLLEYNWAVSAWLIFNLTAVIAIFYFAYPHLPKWIPISFILAYPVVFCLIMGNFSLLSSLALLACLGFLFKQKSISISTQIILGILLTIATYKPQMSWLYILWILLFCYRNRFNHLLISFFGSLFLGSFIMLILFPQWPIDQIRMFSTYIENGHLLPVRMALFSGILSPGLQNLLGNSLLAIFLILTTAWYFVTDKSITEHNLVQICLIGITTYIAHPSGLSYEQICLIIPMICWLAVQKKINKAIITIWLSIISCSYLFFFLEKLLPKKHIISLGPFLLALLWSSLVIYSTIWKNPAPPKKCVFRNIAQSPGKSDSE